MDYKILDSPSVCRTCMTKASETFPMYKEDISSPSTSEQISLLTELTVAIYYRKLFFCK